MNGLGKGRNKTYTEQSVLVGSRGGGTQNLVVNDTIHADGSGGGWLVEVELDHLPLWRELDAFAAGLHLARARHGVAVCHLAGETKNERTKGRGQW